MNRNRSRNVAKIVKIFGDKRGKAETLTSFATDLIGSFEYHVGLSIMAVHETDTSRRRSSWGSACQGS